MVAMFRVKNQHVAVISPAGQVSVYSIGCTERKQLSLTEYKGSDRDNGTDEILAADFSRCGRYFAVCDDHKRAMVWDVHAGWTLLATRTLPRRATALTFNTDSEAVKVLVADKSGDVVEFNVMEEVKDSDIVEHTVLGHVSMLLDLTLSRDNTLLITCDRDEKIRVSHYPHSFIIQSFCLSHTDFVSRLCYIESDDLLLSGSGDGTVKLWNYREGQLLADIDCALHLYPDLSASNSAHDTSSAVLPRHMCHSGAVAVGVGNYCRGADVKGLAVSNPLGSCNSDRIVAASFYRVPAVLLIKLSTVPVRRLEFWRVLRVDSDVVDVTFTNSQHLVILSLCKVSAFSLVLDDTTVTPLTKEGCTTGLYATCQSINTDTAFVDACRGSTQNDVSKLHKVHIDNLSEYISRKQQRIQQHQQQKLSVKKQSGQNQEGKNLEGQGSIGTPEGQDSNKPHNHKYRKNKKWKQRKMDNRAKLLNDNGNSVAACTSGDIEKLDSDSGVAKRLKTDDRIRLVDNSSVE